MTGTNDHVRLVVVVLVILCDVRADVTDYVIIPPALKMEAFKTHVLNKWLTRSALIQPDPVWFTGRGPYALNIVQATNGTITYHIVIERTSKNGTRYCIKYTSEYDPADDNFARWFRQIPAAHAPITHNGTASRLHVLFSNNPAQFIWDFECYHWVPGSSYCFKNVSLLRLYNTGGELEPTGLDDMGLDDNMEGLIVLYNEQRPGSCGTNSSTMVSIRSSDHNHAKSIQSCLYVIVAISLILIGIQSL